MYGVQPVREASERCPSPKSWRWRFFHDTLEHCTFLLW